MRSGGDGTGRACIPRMTRILVVDDDPSSTNAIARWLARPYRTLVCASDGEEALASIATQRPDLLVTDVNMPRLDGWSLVRELRARQTGTPIPVIFLTAVDAEDDRVRGFRMGADDYIPKPVNLDELSLRVERTLYHARKLRTAALPSLRAGIEGSLEQLGPATLLNMLSGGRKTGEFVLWQLGATARLLLSNGRITSAQLDEDESVQGLECVYRALAWSTGQFAFSEVPVPSEDKLRMSVTDILLEAARRTKEGPGVVKYLSEHAPRRSSRACRSDVHDREARDARAAHAIVALHRRIDGQTPSAPPARGRDPSSP